MKKVIREHLEEYGRIYFLFIWLAIVGIVTFKIAAKVITPENQVVLNMIIPLLALAFFAWSLLSIIHTYDAIKYAREKKTSFKKAWIETR